jgi:hypothetical protein
LATAVTIFPRSSACFKAVPRIVPDEVIDYENSRTC